MAESNYVDKVNVGIEPEHVIVTKGDDGLSHTSFMYTLENWGTISMIGLVPIIFLTIILPPIVSAIFLLLYLISFNDRVQPKAMNIIGGLVALYLLIDYHNGWFISQIIGCFFSKGYQLWMLYINLTLLMLHTILFFFGGTLAKLSGGEKNLSIVLILSLGYLLHLVSRVIIDHEIISFIIKVV